MLHKTSSLIVLYILASNALCTKAYTFANNTTMTTDFKLFNSTAMSTTDDLDIAEKRCPVEFCTCDRVDQKFAAMCSGEDIKSVEQLDLPEMTTSLRLIATGIETIQASSFSTSLPNLISLTFDRSRYLHTIESGTFDDLLNLNQLKIIGADKLTHLANDVFGYLPSLEYLSLEHSGLTNVPNLTNLVAHKDYLIKSLTLANNKFVTIQPYTFQGMHHVYELDLSGNQLQHLPNHAFYGSAVNKLNLGNNPLSKLAEDVFVGIKGLTEIVLANTLITNLPTNGLKYILTLDLQETRTLKKFPPVFQFERIETAKLYYFSHCCAFSYLIEQNADYAKLHKIGTSVQTTDCPVTGTSSVSGSPTPSEAVLEPFDGPGHYSSRRSDFEKNLDYYSNWQEDRKSYDPVGAPWPSNMAPFMTNPPGPTNPRESDGEFGQPIDVNRSHEVYGTTCNEFVEKNYKAVNCTPAPNAFNPCADVMGYIFLRIVVWFVAMTALVGNFLVLAVLLAYRHKMTVPKFLMCNLSFADLCMGVYLLMVASVDLHTLGEYFNYAISWQHEAGCKLAGFISIFSSELSVFTLTVLTIERWYTIIYAIDLNKRIRLRQAAKIIVGAWLFAILVATLPMLGVGSYGVTSMCIPFYVGLNDSPITYAYVLFILLFNALAFLIICACYVKMYLTVHNPHTVMQRKDSKVAKRMAVLIFTDFACWAPIAIFGLSAAIGKPLLTVNQSKVLIVLFYPINSCANPFLYAIFTKAFRRDFFMMMAKHGMCEKQAMKYRGAHSQEPRSMSQANSYTSSREGHHHKCHYRGSSASVLTQITSDARSSVAMYEKEPIHESPPKSPKLSHISIPLMPMKETGNHYNLSPAPTCTEQKKPAIVTENQAGNTSANNNNKQPLMKKLSAVLHADYINSDLDTVPEERCSSPDNPELFLEVPEPHRLPFLKAPDAHDYIDDDDDDDDFEDAIVEELKESENERKNSRTDSGIQSNTTTPTDRTDQQISSKPRVVLELLNCDEQGSETTL